MNTLYLQAGPHVDYRKVFADPGGICLRRVGRGNLAYLRGLKRKWIRNIWEMDPVSFRLRDPIQENFRRQLFHCQDGHLYREYVQPGSRVGSYDYPVTVQEDLMLIHLPQRGLAAPGFDMAEVRGFYVTPRGFVQKS